MLALLLAGALLALAQDGACAADAGPLRDLASAARGADDDSTRRFVEGLARRNARFYQAGIGYDAASGVAFDGQNLDLATGEPVSPRTLGAASKEALHLAVLVKAVLGDPIARILVSPGEP